MYDRGAAASAFRPTPTVERQLSGVEFDEAEDGSRCAAVAQVDAASDNTGPQPAAQAQAKPPHSGR